MLSFIRKRLPSKDRTNEHLQNVKSDHIQHGDQVKRAQSSDQLDVNNQEKKKKKKKKKEKSLSNLDQIDNASSPIVQINQSYSDVDYFPMMPGALSQLINRDSLSDCYINPSECVQTINGLNYVQTKPMTTRVLEIPVIDCRNEQQVLNYKGVDHQRTKALREVTEQRTQQKSVK